jgi:uncharacterized protein (TIGR02265 family)
MAQEKLWFSHTVEGLFTRGLGERLTPEHRAMLKEHGIDLEKLKPAYPIDDILAVCRKLTPSLWPGLSEFDAHVQLGVAFMRGYAQTLLGTAMVQVMKLIGPKRTLQRMQTNFRSGGNYIETRFTERSPRDIELWINDTGSMPGLYVGIIEEGARMVGTKGIAVSVTPDVPPAHVFKVTWDA